MDYLGEKNKSINHLTMELVFDPYADYDSTIWGNIWINTFRFRNRSIRLLILFLKNFKYNNGDSMNNPSILIIEDETLIAMELQQKVISWGYECPFTACTSEEAVNWALKNPPDLILADVFLRDKDNTIETIYTIKKLFEEKYTQSQPIKTSKKHHKIPVIFFSGCVDDEVINLTNDLDPYSILNKPINYPKLKLCVKKALK